MKNLKYFLFIFALVSVVCIFASSNVLAQNGGDDPPCCGIASSAPPSLGISAGLMDVAFPLTMPEVQSSSSVAPFSSSTDAMIRYETAVVEQKYQAMQWLS
jgi:hypothetical protein